jgi:dihydroorotate dehydrogenase (NAD+) catalytic subunit
MTGTDVAEYLLAGASAVGLGTVHLAEPRAGKRIRRELIEEMDRARVRSVAELVAGVVPW